MAGVWQGSGLHALSTQGILEQGKLGERKYGKKNGAFQKEWQIMFDFTNQHL